MIEEKLRLDFGLPTTSCGSGTFEKDSIIFRAVTEDS